MSSRKWLMKTEPDVYSIADLEAEGRTPWEGIRNYQARNFMMNDMCVGDEVFIYHSNAKPPGIVGLGTICSDPYPDHFAWNDDSKYFDPKSTPSSPRWFMVDVQYKATFSAMISLNQLKTDRALVDMMVVQKGARLSIQPVSIQHFDYILRTYTT
ncbi:MAG: EVE domain-containing protein [Candidatus Marinamargulisbacteria bacterium]